MTENQDQVIVHRRYGVRFALLATLTASLALLFPSSALKAQVQTGINGSVVDATGALIPGAKVTITNTQTGVVSNATSSSVGTYTVIGLLPGLYSVAVSASGFKTFVTQVTVEVARMSSLDVAMQPGATNETVNVNSTGITLETTSPAVGTTLEPELVSTMPVGLSGTARQIDAFIYFAPGVQGGSNPPAKDGVNGGIQSSANISGGVSLENEVQFNGVPVAFVQNQGVQTNVNPPFESISEFRVNTSTFDPQFGVGQGAVTFNMASGTNQFHADVFEILRNQLFDSSGFFPTRFGKTGNPLPPINHQNDWGITVGGPVILPKLYHGRNRTFFHFSGDFYQQNQAVTSLGTVPTAEEKTGDFSNFLNGNGVQIPIYDPQTGQQFPGNKIPQQRFSGLAKALLPLIPAPDNPGIIYGQQSNKNPAVSSAPITQSIWDYTIDHNLSSSQSVHFSQWRDNTTQTSYTSAPIVTVTNMLQSGIYNQNLGTGYLLNYVKTVNPNFVVTAGADAIGNIIGQHNADPGVSFAAVVGNTFPLINFDGENAPTAWGSGGSQGLANVSSGLSEVNKRMLGFVAVNNWLWIKGRHTFNFGAQLRRSFQDIVQCNWCSGTFQFSQRTTSTPSSADPNFGDYGSSFASFLLGLVDASARISASEEKLRNKAFAFYAQDNYKVNDRLTLNLGARYDVLVPFTVSSQDVVYVDLNLNVPDPAAGNLPGGASKYGHCQGCSGITRATIHWGYIQPRIGVSYQLGRKTVIQGGGYTTMLNGGAYEYGTTGDAISFSSLLQGQFLRVATGGNAPSYGSWDTQTLAVPQHVAFSPSIGNGGIITNLPTSKHNPKGALPSTGSVGTTPYEMAWNVRVQRQLPYDLYLTAAYIGSRTVHLPTTNELSDQPNPSVLQYGDLLGKSILDPAVVAAGFTPPYPNFVNDLGGGASLEQALTPYPQYGGYYPAYEMDGTALYNSLQFEGQRRFSNGLSLLSQITFARDTSNEANGSVPAAPNGLNAYDPQAEWGPSFYDQLYSSSIVGTYELPIGPGKLILNSHNLASNLLGGWTVSGVLQYAGGFPMGTLSSGNPLLVNGFNRPNIVSGVSLATFSYGRTRDYYTGKSSVLPVQFTTNAFANPGTWGVGTSIRAYRALRSEPLRREDFVAIKDFHIEKLRASIRMDYFNAFNRTRFIWPDITATSSTFGEVTNLSSQLPNRQGQAEFRIEF